MEAPIAPRKTKSKTPTKSPHKSVAKVKKPVISKTKTKITPPAKPSKKSTQPSAAESITLKNVLHSLDQDKGIDVKTIDLQGRSSIADYMVIATGTSSRHVAGMADKLKQKLSKEGYRARIEGAATGDWVIVDAGDVIVHLFRAEVRSFYNLEKLWGTDFSAADYTFYQSGA